MTSPLPDADMLRRLLIRKFLITTIGGRGSILVAQDPEAAASTPMAVVGRVLEGLSAEGEFLRATISSEEGRR